MKPSALLAAALAALVLPGAALADKPAHAGRNGPPAHSAAQQHGEPERSIVREGRRNGAVVISQAHCPPGLARKDPPCIPPGQARNSLVGSAIDWDRVHVVRKPGLYGLANAPQGQRYAIVDGRLVRVDSRTAKVLSVIRAVEAIVD